MDMNIVVLTAKNKGDVQSCSNYYSSYEKEFYKLG